jgi:hypothetical protein
MSVYQGCLSHVGAGRGSCLFRFKSICASRLLACLCILSGALTVSAETRVVTLLPDSAATISAKPSTSASTGDVLTISDQLLDRNRTESILCFAVKLSTLPLNSRIERIELRLVREKGAEQGARDMTIDVKSVGCDGKASVTPTASAPVAMIESRTGSEDLAVFTNNEIVKRGPEPAPGFIGLLLTTGAQKRGSGSFRNYASLTRTGDAASQPRLIITYSPASADSTASAPEWQTSEPAGIRGTKDFVTTPAAQGAIALRGVVTGSYAGMAVSYGELSGTGGQEPLWWTIDGDGKKLVARKTFGELIGSGITLPRTVDPTWRMVVNASGRLTLAGADAIFVYQLNAANPDSSTRLYYLEGKNFRSGGPDALLPGIDGALYAVSGNVLMALNPDLRLLWETPVLGQPDTVRMSMSPGGRFLYAVDGARDKSVGLHVVNAQTGTSELLAFSATAVHVPVIARRSSTGQDWVFIAGNTTTGGWLRCVINAPDKYRPGVADLSAVPGWEKQDRFFSQPVLDRKQNGDAGGRVLYVAEGNGKETAISARTMATGDYALDAEHKPMVRVVGNMPVDDRLWRAGGPVIDAVDNVFFLEGATLFGFDKDLTQKFSIDSGAMAANTNLLFGPRGTLLESEATRLRAIVPQFDANGQAAVTSMADLSIKGTSTANLTLKVGNVLLLQNFTLRQGNTLTIAKP